MFRCCNWVYSVGLYAGQLTNTPSLWLTGSCPEDQLLRNQLPQGQLPPDQLPIVEYFDRTWVNGQYRISQWNYYDYHGPRTSNHVEGWHSQQKKIVGKSHQNIYEIIDVMRKEQWNSTSLKPMLCSHPKKEVCVRLSMLFERFQNAECMQLSQVFSCCLTSNWTLVTIISYWWICVCILTFYCVIYIIELILGVLTLWELTLWELICGRTPINPWTEDASLMNLDTFGGPKHVEWKSKIRYDLLVAAERLAVHSDSVVYSWRREMLFGPVSELVTGTSR